jgi:hypothetical protein
MRPSATNIDKNEKRNILLLEIYIDVTTDQRDSQRREKSMCTRLYIYRR